MSTRTASENTAGTPLPLRASMPRARSLARLMIVRFMAPEYSAVLSGARWDSGAAGPPRAHPDGLEPVAHGGVRFQVFQGRRQAKRPVHVVHRARRVDPLAGAQQFLAQHQREIRTRVEQEPQESHASFGDTRAG